MLSIRSDVRRIRKAIVRGRVDPADLVGLRPLMERTEGRPEITVGVIDGPVSLEHPALSGRNLRFGSLDSIQRGRLP